MGIRKRPDVDGAAANSLLWLVVINTFILVVFAFSFARPRDSRDWRVALFTEMYGFPLTVYLMSGWLARFFPQANPFDYSAGQLWHTLFGLDARSLFNPVQMLSCILITSGFVLVAYAWRYFTKLSAIIS